MHNHNNAAKHDHVDLSVIRIVKQTLRSSGANATATHIEEVSLSALFLLEAAKKTDREFSVTPVTKSHCTRCSTGYNESNTSLT